MNAVRVVVVGCGYLGSIHARLWMQDERAVLVGVHDTLSQRAESLAQELGVVAFPSLDSALDACDAVTVAVPTMHHASVTLAAIEHGKHVLLEKPVAATIADAEAIAAAAERAGTVVHVGHVERYNAAFRRALGYVTRPLFIEAHRLSPFRVRGTDVSVISDLMIHDLDLVLALVRQPVIRVEAHGVAVMSDSIDIANARIEFSGGCIANLTASRLTPKPLRKLRIFQPSTYISLDFSEPGIEVYRLAEDRAALAEIGSELQLSKAIVREQPTIAPVNAIADEHRAFIASILDDVPAVVSLNDGIAALRLALQIEHAIVERMQTLRSE